MSRAVIAAGSARRRVVSSGSVTFDSAATPYFQISPAGGQSTSSWTVGTSSNRYLLAFTGAWNAGTTQSASGVNHSGSGGTALTSLIADYLPVAHFFTAGRVFGMSSPTSGSGTTYATWAADQVIASILALSYSGVSGVGDIQPNVQVEAAATSGFIETTVSTPNASDLVVAFGWCNGDTGTRTPSAGSGVISRGGGTSADFYGAIALEKARTGSTTSIRMDVTGTGGTRCEMAMIALVLQAA